MEHKGLRFNAGKVRYDLLEPYALENLAKVFTRGAEKYAPRNWERGMAWSSITASLKRHLAAFERGEDYDKETGLYHMAHAAWNAMALLSYYKLYPEGDDRAHNYLVKKKIGLDIDEVLCNFTGGWAKVYPNVSPTPDSWYFDRDIGARFEEMRAKGTLNDFYLNLEPVSSPGDISFDPVCYVTSRPVDSVITEQWLDKHGFPRSPVITVGIGNSKVDALKKAGVDIFVDDSFGNFQQLNAAGIMCYLYDASHNRKYDVGYKRIKSLTELGYGSTIQNESRKDVQGLVVQRTQRSA